MSEELEIVSDAEIDSAMLHTNFGGMANRDVVRQGVLKCASGYHQGHTSMTICKDLGLISHEYEVTAKGRQYLWAAFSTKISV
ncbi:hypothetical protein [Pseudomonas sp.]|uniref:hypothetical protein n=1 Tax=Pseudomonas sp. TaxID=306 RepID=UPI003FD849D5